MVTYCPLELRIPVCATKVAVVAPEATVTDAGTVSTLALLAKLTTSAAAAAAAKVTVQVTLELLGTTISLFTTVPAQLSPEITSAGSTVRVAAGSAPFNRATIVASVTLVTDVVVARNVPVVLPAVIVKVGGTVTAAELLVRVIDTPPEPALPDRVTVHVLEAPPATVAGAQLTEEIVTAGVTVRDAVWEEPL
jgi:hypothetical protein